MSESLNNTNFKCPNCGANKGSYVTDSRAPLGGEYIRRRRKCNACGHKFSTREVVFDYSETEDGAKKLKPEDVMRLRALATEILNQTNSLVPSADLVRPEDSLGR